MIARLALAILLSSAAAAGQLQLFHINAPGQEQPVGGEFNVGTAPGGDYLDTKFRIRNLSLGTVTLERLRISGTGFSLEGHPFIPFAMGSGTNVDFRVRFRPGLPGTYSAVLRFNDTYVMVYGTSPATVQVVVEQEGQRQVLGSGDIVLFGRLEQGLTATRRLWLENPGAAPLEVATLAVVGEAFRLESAPAAPLTLAPGGSLPFDVVFEPPSARLYQATLRMNDRSFLLEGVGLYPAYPQLEVLVDPPVLRSGQQAKLTVRLAGPSPAAGSGSIGLAFTPAAEGALEDPAVLFLSNSERWAPLHVEKGGQNLTVDGAAEGIFQTGTTAGTLTVTAEFGNRRRELTFTLAPEPVVIDRSTTAATATGLRLSFTGYDNTRSVSTISFQFFDRAGEPLTDDPIAAKVEEAFLRHFAAGKLGGVFSLVAEFPVAGDKSLIGAVDVRFQNDAGATALPRLSF